MQGPQLAANSPQTSLPANSQKPHASELESRVGAKTALDPSVRVDQERGGLPPPPGARGDGRHRGWGYKNRLTPASEHVPIPSREIPHSPCPWQSLESRKHSVVHCPFPCDVGGSSQDCPGVSHCAAGLLLARALPTPRSSSPWLSTLRAEKEAHIWPLPSWGVWGHESAGKYVFLAVLAEKLVPASMSPGKSLVPMRLR